MSFHLGPKQIAIMRTASHGRWFLSNSHAPKAPGGYTHLACLKLHGYGLLRRDPANSYRWTATEKGDAWIEAHDDALEAALS